MRRLSIGVLGIVALFCLASSPATAIPQEGALTLDPADDPLAFTAGGASGQIQAIDPVRADLSLSEIDSVCLAGVCDLVNQDWIIFEVNVTAGSLDGVGVGLLSQSSLGLGYFLEGGPVQDGSGLTDTYTGSIGTPTVPQFTFLDNSTTAGLSGTSLVLFVAYANNTLPQTPPGPFAVYGEGAVNFMITEWGTAEVNTLLTIGNFTEPVPEPGTALLLGMGVLLLGASARNRRS